MASKRIKPRREQGKRVAAPSPTQSSSIEQQKPIFSLQYLRSDYCLSACTKDEKAALANTLYKLSPLTWNQISSSPRHGVGYERISRDAIRSPIPNHLKNDVNFLAFRFFGKAPIVGYRDRNIFHIVWIDRAFSLYAHG